MFFEALAVQNLLPLNAGEPGSDPRLRTAIRSGEAQGGGKKAKKTEATHLCYSVHFGTAERPIADALLAFTRATREKLLCEPQMMDQARGMPPDPSPRPCDILSANST